MSIEILLIYSVVSFFYIISPGPAVFLAISNGITANMKTVAVSSLGNIIGLFILSTISMLGLGTLLMTSSLLFMAVKVIGAAYLVYLGFRQIALAKKVEVHDATVPARHTHLRGYFYESFFIAVTNPKPILFFIAFFPQFLNTDKPIMGQFIALTLIFMMLSFLSLISYGYISKSVKSLLSKHTVMQWFHRVTGGIFIIMGLSLLKLKNNAAN